MHSSSNVTISRRSFLRRGGSTLAAAAVLWPQFRRAGAQAASDVTPFSFEMLVDQARLAATEDFTPPKPLGPPFDELDYDDYRNIQFREQSALWTGPHAGAVLHAYHPGWLFDGTVDLYEVEDGAARLLHFTSDDFRYYGSKFATLPDTIDLPGVAGFRLNAPLNAPDRYDEVVSFLGASYFRALGAGNRYGLSARGLAVNTATSESEEFPRFSAFWLERPHPDSDVVTFYARLDSESVTGAFKFVLTPGETTTIDVRTELFFRRDVQQLGVAPLTSMFLFGPNDRGRFDDYRARVHDSEAMIINSDQSTLFRVLNNPPRLANSYFSAQSPQSFGLVQRHRAFDDYLDAGAHYELRPTLMVEPMGDWGKGMIRLIEIPSDLEANDNIVAFWVPEGDFAAGDSLSIAYRLHWGMNPPGAEPKLAQISRTLAGHGGVSGVKPQTDRRKFVIDFEGEPLGELQADVAVTAQVNVTGGSVAEQVLQKVEGYDQLWRLVIEVVAENDATVELRADLVNGDHALTETWVYQWLQE